jgi:putative PIN family toxin of toxin-antitoxin system
MSDAPRLVFDTNILISHLLIPTSIPGQAVRKGLHTGRLIVSDDTLNELAAVISRPKFDRYISLQNRKDFFRFLGRVVERVTIIRNIQACRDPNDDKFLELAVNGQAETIITGDQDLLALHPFRSIQIITPSEFLDQSP